MQRNLFGVPVPPGAVRVVVRPVLGRGGALPLYKAALDDGPIDEDEIVAAASKNAAFWEYVDARQLANKDEVGPSWKLRLQFFDNNQAEESATTEKAFEFFRSPRLQTAATEEGPAGAHRTLKSLKRSTDKTLRKLLDATSNAIAQISTAATAAIQESAKAAAGALAEASKQTTVVSELAKAHLLEASELKHAVFELQTERAKTPAQPPKSVAQEFKEVLDVGKTVMGFVENLSGGADPDPSPPADPKSADGTGDK